jgi:autotransporter passenger strand-loop-strand repeat protein
MQINFYKGTNFSSAPSWLTTVLFQVSAFYDKLFTNNITLNLAVNWVDLGTDVLASNDLYGSGDTQGVTSSYSTVISKLDSHEQTQTQAEAYSYLPSGPSNIYVAPGEAEVLGLLSGTSVSAEISVGSNVDWTKFDAFAAIAHEITESAMGRTGQLGSDPTVMDLFRYTSAGGSPQHDLTSGTSASNTTAYFSVNGGATNLGVWNNNTGPYSALPSGSYDLGDWVTPNWPDKGDPNGDPIANDALGAQAKGVTVDPISEVDIELMNVLGWSTDAVTAGNTFDVYSGQTVSGYYIMSGGAFAVLSGGVANGAYYTDAQGFADGDIMPGSAGGNGGNGYIYGVEYNATVDAGSKDWIESRGDSFGATVRANGSQINYGVTKNTVLSGGYEGVAGSASTYYTSVLSGGVLHLDSGSFGFGDIVRSGGSETVWGFSKAETILGFGTQTVASGGTDDSSLVSGAQYDFGTSENGDIYGKEYIYFRGVDSSTTVERGGEQYVYGSSVRGTVDAGATQYVSSDGSSVSAKVDARGTQYVFSGGIASATDIYGVGSTYAGGVDSSTTIESGGVQWVYGHSHGAAIATSGNQYVYGDSLYATIASGGGQDVKVGGTATYTDVFSGGYQGIFGSSLGAGVEAGGTQHVYSGGVASSTSINGSITINGYIGSAGTEYTDAGGVDSSTYIGLGGVQYVYGESYNATINTYGNQYIESGGYAYGTNDGYSRSLTGSVAAGQYVEAGGVTSHTSALTSVGDQYVSGGDAYDTILSGGGAQYVYSSGHAYGSEILSGGVEYVNSSGVDSATVIYNGGIELVDSGGAAGYDTVVSGGAQYVLFDGYVDGTKVLSGGVEYVYSGGAADYDMVESGGAQYVLFGGHADGTNVLSGGVGYVYSGGAAYYGTVESGGAQYVLFGGHTEGTNVRSGGVEYVSSGGVVSASAVPNGGKEYVYGGGAASSDTVASGGVLYDYGVTSKTTVSKVGTEDVFSGGYDYYGKVYGSEVVSSGGAADYDMVESGGAQYVLFGGHADGTNVVSGGVEYVYSGGVDSASVISSGGKEYVYKGGATYSDSVASGGAQYDYGVTSNTTISKGGAEDVFSGGLADYSQVYGNEFVSSGGKGYGDTIHSGGDVYVYSGGVESGSVVSSGGDAFVSSGGVFSGGKVVDSVLTVSSGGFVSGGLTISGSGTANISGTVASGQDVLFSGTGDLALANLSNFHALIGGYSSGDEFDLRSFAYGSGEAFSYTEAASLLSGTLGVHDGTLTASLTLLGKYATGDFALSNDSHGGSFVKFV